MFKDTFDRGASRMTENVAAKLEMQRAIRYSGRTSSRAIEALFHKQENGEIVYRSALFFF